jgi:2-polyprenyl-3-methyl-5-hydroxy-6-metoxy-1,4-benzoquinol methylase
MVRRPPANRPGLISPTDCAHSMDHRVVSTFVDRLIALAQSGPKPVPREMRSRAKVLRRQARDLVRAKRHAESLPSLTELAELTADPGILRQIAIALKKLERGGEAARILAAIGTQANAGQRTKKGPGADASGSRERRKPGAVAELAAAERLLWNSDQIRSNDRIIAGLEQLVSENLGIPVRHVRSEGVERPKARPDRAHNYFRTYTRHWLELTGPDVPETCPDRDADGRLVVFAKAAINMKVLAKLESSLSKEQGRGFRVPYFFGCFEDFGLLIRAWEAVRPDPVPLDKQPWQKQERLVRAVAAANARVVNGAVPPMDLAALLSRRWLERAQQNLDEAEQSRWADLYPRTIEALDRQETCYRNMQTNGDTFLCHNDLHIGNVIVPDRGDVILFDWESASLGVVGTDLGFLDSAANRTGLIRCYVEEMAKYGHRLDPRKVAYVADVTWGYRMLRRGWVRRDFGLAERSLRLLEMTIMQDERVPVNIERLIALVKGGRKQIDVDCLPRLEELRRRTRELCNAERFAEALPLLVEFAEITGNPAIVRRIARVLRRLERRDEASRLMGPVRKILGTEMASREKKFSGKSRAPGTGTERANYVDRYGYGQCRHLLRIDGENEAAVMQGAIPRNLEWIVPMVPGRTVLEVGAGEGILSLALAGEKEHVIGIDMTPVRHEKAKEIQSAWRELGRDVDRCEFVLGDVFENRHLFKGVDTVVACHVIYYFIDRLEEFMKLISENVRYACFIGNAGRARHYKEGDHSRLQGQEYYSTLEGMTEILERHGFSIAFSSEERAPIVIGEMPGR